MSQGRILVINDDDSELKTVKNALVDYDVVMVKGSAEAIFEARSSYFDVVIVKVAMPDMPGKLLMKEIKQIDPDCIFVPIVEASTIDAFEDILRLGVDDYINKDTSLKVGDIFFAVHRAITLRHLKNSFRALEERYTMVSRQRNLLETRITESTRNVVQLYKDLQDSYMRAIKALAHAIDARDHFTHKHSENVTHYAVMIAEETHLPFSQVEEIRQACELHDLGKIGVSDEILSKPGKLTDDEWEKIRLHSIKGAEILGALEHIKGVAELVRQHHERYDGKGYPDGRKGEQILIGARIISVADTYEAMTSPRSYRKEPLTKEQAVEEIKHNSGTQFDPRVVEVFLKVVNKF